jgi:hypothetical protein
MVLDVAQVVTQVIILHLRLCLTSPLDLILTHDLKS